MTNFILCRICNKKYHKGGIAMHIKGNHQMIFRDYIKKFIRNFPDDFPYWRLRNENKLVRISSVGKKKIAGNFQLPLKNIQCRICNQFVGTKGFPIHIKNLHNISYKEYINLYFDVYPSDFFSWRRCEICGKITKQKRNCSRECDRKYRKTLVGEKAPRFGVKLTKEIKNKISKTNKKFYSDSKNHWAYGTKVSDERRKRISKSQKLNAQRTDYVNPMQGKTHTPEAIKKIFSHKKMNTIEKIVADELAKNKIEYYFQYFLTRNGICKSFDFKIKNKKLFIEVDGDYWHGGPGSVGNYFKGVDEVKENDKFKEQLAKENGFEVIRIWESELKKDINILMERLND